MKYFVNSIILFTQILIALWSALFLTISLDSFYLGHILCTIYCVGSCVLLYVMKPFRRGLAYAAIFPVLTLIFWCLQFPSNSREWQDDVKVLPWAEINGDEITIHNIRNNRYRSEMDYDVQHYNKTVHLDDLTSVDLILVDWGLEKIVHTMFSFGFKDGSYICCSVETRKEQGEEYSAINGFFRQYELMYVMADERDLIGVRTHHRKGENVYIYPLTPKNGQIGKDVFMEYIYRINALKEKPEWYNALTENCMTSSYILIRKHAMTAVWHWKVILNGYVAELAYDHGSIFNEIPYEEVKEKSLINSAALSCTDPTQFSQAIRAGLPGRTKMKTGSK